MDFLVGSDLAAEWSRSRETGLMGISTHVRKIGEVSIEEVRVESREAAEALGKPMGCYLTFSTGQVQLLSDLDRALLVHLLSGRLRGMTRRLTGKEINGKLGILVAGLGNRHLTADALGPMTVSRLDVTRHIGEYEPALYQKMGCCAISALSPGVLGQTGLEVLALVQGAVRAAAPDLVIAVDALAAWKCERLGSTVQMSDVGIEPGSGVGNHRAALSAETLGVPVIAIGVPTVVSSAVLVQDALSAAGIDPIPGPMEKLLHSGKSFFVSPKESDAIAEAYAVLLADAIKAAFTDL